MKVEPTITKAEVRASKEKCACLRALRDSLDDFFTIFVGSLTLDISITDKVFKAIFNIHFYHLSIRITVDLSVVFDL